jgi:uncharacterized protein YndB with AHSA1/START domain
MILKLLIGFAIVGALFALAVSRRPSAFHLQRSIDIAAPPERAFAMVVDFRAWRGWSPYEKLDPEMMRLYGGPPSGVGTSYTWAGSSKVGEGRMTIERSVPGSLIDLRLEFIKPFASTSRATFTFEPSARGTTVTWAMDGHNGFLAKAMHLLMDIESLIGAQFESGLAALKALAEAEAPSAARSSGAALSLGRD